MSNDIDIFAQTSYGKAALRKLGKVPENFMLYEAGWIGDKPENWNGMRVKGCVFRAATKGPRVGQFVIPVPGTIQSVIVTRDEILAEDKDAITSSNH